ncbi:MAG: cupin domain-containing protein [Alphaproteobacteria bacterium]
MSTNQEVHADYSEHVTVHTSDLAWERDGETGVSRKLLEFKLLDSKGDAETARVTEIIRLDPGTTLSTDGQEEAEEFYVVSGSFSDDHGEYGKGMYVLNPPAFSKEIFSKEGCELFHKTRQGTHVRERVVIDTEADSNWQPFRGGRMIPFYEYEDLDMHLGFLPPDAKVPMHAHNNGEEIFVIDGTIEDEYGLARVGTWIRFPIGLAHQPFTEKGCTFYVKEGHLRR